MKFVAKGESTEPTVELYLEKEGDGCMVCQAKSNDNLVTLARFTLSGKLSLTVGEKEHKRAMGFLTNEHGEIVVR